MTARDVLVAGETLVDFIPDRPGPLDEVETFTRRAGGAPANVAVGLARLERTPWFCTTLATDPFGRFLAAVLADEGLPDRFVTTTADARTTLAFVSHDADADRGFTFYRENGADTYLDTAVVPDETLAAAAYVVVGGVTLTVEPARTATLSLLERAREHGCTVVFDPNDRPELWAADVDRVATLKRALSLSDVVKATDADVGDLPFVGADVPRSLLAVGPHTVFRTRGPAGATVRTSERSPWGRAEWFHDGYDVDPVDTTGAGDAFTAGVVAALVDGSGPTETLAFANAVAAAAVTGDGAMTALPDRERVARLLPSEE
ncbi:MAG: carbohydrate kinase [Haloarculaceae archaeon]